MRPPLIVLRSVARDSHLCQWCGFGIQPFDAAYALMVSDTALLTCCSYRCSEEHARFHKRLPLTVRYAEAS